MPLLPKLIASATAIAMFGSLAPAASAETCPTATWQKVEPGEAGWSTSGLKKADALARELGSDSFAVIQKGKIVWRFGNVHASSNVHSVRKSIASLLYGVAHDAGQIHLDRTLAELRIDDGHGALSATEKTATVRNLLMARSCIYQGGLRNRQHETEAARALFVQAR